MDIKMDFIKAAFESNFSKSVGCWTWNGGLDSHGYGRLYYKGRSYKAHRVSYALYKGELPKWDGHKSGICVLHKCDNPRCVNPDHLFLGSQADNMRDKAIKGRSIGAHSCEKHHKAKLTSREVVAIRKDARSNSFIGKLYGVSKETIRGIKKGFTWKAL
jgi:hypothetical protein